jgi:membrane protease YdiL (CAAX protease family)
VVGSGNKQADRGGELSALRRVRYLIDIIVLAAATVAVERGFGAVYVPTSPQSGVVFDFIVKLPAVLFAWLLIRLRRETLADVGLKRPGSWSRAFLIGLVVTIIVFLAAYISEKIGLRRDLSQFRAVQGNLELTLYEVAYAFIGAGFYEEFMFRGFLWYGLAMFLGASRGAWVVACILQGLLFGLAHAYQNPLGIAFTGAVGMLMGFLFLASGRNLWPLIIGHGLYDASRFVLFYFKGPPLG